MKIQAKKRKKIMIYKRDIMQLFSGDATMFTKKNPENMKNLPSKVAHNPPKMIFSVLAKQPKWPKNKSPVPTKAP